MCLDQRHGKHGVADRRPDAPLASLTSSAFRANRENLRGDDSDPAEAVGVLVRVDVVRQLLLGELSFAVIVAVAQYLQKSILWYLHCFLLLLSVVVNELRQWTRCS